MKILVVEDEDYVAELLRRALESMGNACLHATGPAQAELLLGQHAVDAITLDLALSGCDGLDWLEALAGSRPDLARRTLVITGRPLEASSAARVARCGAGALAKPFTIASLHEAVRVQLSHVPRD